MIVTASLDGAHSKYPIFDNAYFLVSVTNGHKTFRTVPHRVEIVKIYYQNGCSVPRVFRALREVYNIHNRPIERTIRRLIEKFEATESVANRIAPVRQRSARSNENIAAVCQCTR